MTSSIWALFVMLITGILVGIVARELSERVRFWRNTIFYTAPPTWPNSTPISTATELTIAVAAKDAGPPLTGMIEFVFRTDSDSGGGGGGATPMNNGQSRCSPFIEALNTHLTELAGTHKLHMGRWSGPYMIVTREEIPVDVARGVYARLVPFGNTHGADSVRQWVERMRSSNAEGGDDEACPALPESAAENTDSGYMIYLYSTQLSASELHAFVSEIYEREMKRRADQLGKQLFYFKEVGSAIAMAEMQNARSLASEQIQAQLMADNNGSGASCFGGGGGGVGLTSASAITAGLQTRAAATSMLRGSLGLGGSSASACLSAGGSAASLRPFQFMMTPFHTNKRMGNLVGAIFREIHARITRFSENREWYVRRGLPHTFGLLMHGAPGTGKTSLMKALARELDRHIFDMTIHPGTTQRQMFDFFHDETVFVQPRQFVTSAPVGPAVSGGSGGGSGRGAALPPQQQTHYHIPLDKRLLVFDDFMAGTNVFLNRALYMRPEALASTGALGGSTLASAVSNGNDPLTTQFVLNLLDGVLEHDGRVMVLGDNHPELVDPAFLRPGRVDMIVELGPLSLRCAQEYVVMYFEVTDASVVEALFRSYADMGEPFIEGALTGAEMQRVLLNHQDDSVRRVVHAVVGESRADIHTRLPAPPLTEYGMEETKESEPESESKPEPPRDEEADPDAMFK